MFVFTVSVSVKSEIASEWQVFMLDKHINDVLKTGCFIKAEFEELESDIEDNKQYRARYYFLTKPDFERYLEHFSSDLRAEHNQLFGAYVEAKRTISKLKEFFVI